MSRRLIVSSIFLLAPAAAAQTTAPATAPAQTWTYGGRGEWTKSAAPPTTQFVENPTLDRAERLLAARRHEPARQVLLTWLRAHRHAPDRDRAVFLLAEAYYQYGDRIRAFYHLDEVMDTWPDSRLFYPALERQYEIADHYLRGYKRRLFKLPILGAEEEAVDMLFRIQERAPGSPIAERALLRTADYYYSRAQYDLAADAYGVYARSYPRSPAVPRVKLRQAFASLAQFRGLHYDATPLVDARAQLVAIRGAFPDLAEAENVDAVVERIDQSMAGKLYWTGDFYRRTNQPRAAVYTYRYLISRYPQSREATAAQQRLGRMPQWALATPPPTPSQEGEETILTTPQNVAPRKPGVTPGAPRLP